MNNQHIGAAGELLVQYQLLKLGIDSARLTTDAGIDLVVYAPRDRSATTVQVKANLGAKRLGGPGAPLRSWYFPHDCRAQVLALVALDTDTVWMLTLEEAHALAQQHSGKGVRQIYWRLEAGPGGPTPRRCEAQMADHLLVAKAHQFFLGGNES